MFGLPDGKHKAQAFAQPSPVQHRQCKNKTGTSGKL
jgi:hypothetical protein